MTKIQIFTDIFYFHWSHLFFRIRIDQSDSDSDPDPTKGL